MNLAKKERYVVNLNRLQNICSRNYGLLLRLLPLHYKVNQQWLININEQLYFDLTVQEITPYTERFLLKQQNRQMPSVCNLEIEFRLYHDAQMVEVIKYQQQERIRANNEYPNDKLHQKDEKTQINQLLKDWLNLAFQCQTSESLKAVKSQQSEK